MLDFVAPSYLLVFLGAPYLGGAEGVELITPMAHAISKLDKNVVRWSETAPIWKNEMKGIEFLSQIAILICLLGISIDLGIQ